MTVTITLNFKVCKASGHHAPLERGLSKSKKLAMAAMAATFWSQKGKTAIFGKSEQPWQATLPNLPRTSHEMVSEKWPFSPTLGL
jgi:hypothetical protein